MVRLGAAMKRFALTALAVAIAVAGPSPTFAQEAATIEALDEKVEKLEREMEALRAALAELAELDRQRMEILQRVVSRDGAPPKAPPPVARKAPPPKRRDKSGVVQGRVKVPNGEPVAYVFVENVRGRAVKDRTVTMQQRNKQFAPGWAVVERGTTVEFPNMDAIYHNVFSLSEGNTFDLGLYRAGESAKSYRFLNAGVVDLYCNIHPRMAASLLVLPNRYFAKVQPDGTFRIDGVPSGKRKIVAWAPGSSVASTWTDVGGAGSEVTLTLEKRSGSHKNKFNKPYGSYP